MRLSSSTTWYARLGAASDVAYLDAALDEVRKSYGAIEGYFADGLGLGSDGLEALRRTFLDGSSMPEGRIGIAS